MRPEDLLSTKTLKPRNFAPKRKVLVGTILWEKCLGIKAMKALFECTPQANDKQAAAKEIWLKKAVMGTATACSLRNIDLVAREVQVVAAAAEIYAWLFTREAGGHADRADQAARWL